MAGQIRSVSGMAGALGLLLLAPGLAPSAGAQTPPDALTEADPPAAAGARPDFYVPWNPAAPGLTARPALRRGGLPRYPPGSITAKETGKTTLEACITVEGRLTDIRVRTSSGFERLDQAVLDWARTAAYSPARFNGQPFAVCGFPLSYQWRLER